MKWLGDEWRGFQRVLTRCFPRRIQRPARSSPAELRVLALVPEGQNRRVLQAAVQEAGWKLSIADSAAAWRAPHADVPPIVIFDRELSPHEWGESIRLFANRTPKPYIILLSPSSDTNLWDELYRAGGSEIVRTPIDPGHLLWAVLIAWQLWRTQQFVRSPLPTVTR